MVMSKKDFELVAEVMKEGLCQDGSEEDVFIQSTRTLTLELAWAFEDRYPNFDKEKFLAAVGVKP